MKRSGLMTSKVVDLRASDIIQVPVENCKIIDIQAVPSQMYDRKQKLFKIKVSPQSGPWSNCEGEFIIGSMEDMVVVEKYQPPGLLSRIASAVAAYITRSRKPKLEELPSPKHELWS